MYYVIYPVFLVISVLPFKVLYALSDFLYLIIYYVAGYRRKVVRKNLTKSFPDKSFSEIITIEKKFYHYFADLMLETIKVLTISEREASKRVTFVNPDKIVDIIGHKNSVILMTAHYGNWEWGSFFSRHLKGLNAKNYQIYKELENEAFDKIIYRLRSRFGGENIEKNRLLRAMIKNKASKQYGAYSMVADQIPATQSIGIRLGFLHQSTAVLTGSEQLAQRFGFPVFYAKISKIKRGYFQVEFIPVCLEPEKSEKSEITVKYFKLLEETIQQQPELWLWSHNRWKR